MGGSHPHNKQERRRGEKEGKAIRRRPLTVLEVKVKGEFSVCGLERDGSGSLNASSTRCANTAI